MAELPSPLEPAVWQGAQACRLGLHQALCSLAASPGATSGAATPWHDGVRELICIDKHFAFWPLDEPEVLQALSIWLRKPGRRLSLLALDYATTALSLPRFARWRRDYAHCINAWQPVEGGLPAGLRGLWTRGQALQWQEGAALELRSITNPVQLAPMRAASADFLQRCEPAWPVTTLGL